MYNVCRGRTNTMRRVTMWTVMRIRMWMIIMMALSTVMTRIMIMGKRECLRLVGYMEKFLRRDHGKFFGQEKGTECRFIGAVSEFRSRTKTVVEIHECGNWQTNSMII